jgi:hypothetical protein
MESSTLQRRAVSRSPLTSRPLRLPGQSVQEALEGELWDGFIPYLIAALFFAWAAAMEWFAVWWHLPRQPWLYTVMAGLAVVVCGWRFTRVRRNAAALRLGRDGEQAVGQFLERLRARGAQVFHDVPGDGFNLDHVVLSSRGFFVVETKTRSKPVGRDARVTLTDRSIRIGGLEPDRDPIEQVHAGARWLAQLLEESTGKRFLVKGAIVFPGWFVEPMSADWRSAGLPWVLEPKALPKFIQQEREQFSREDVRLAAYHLSRYVRAKQAELAKIA